MIQSLTIDNYALIDALEIGFDSGFSVITGETGSGKSIILGALGLLLGGRSDNKTLRNDGKKCVIEGTFGIAGYGMQPFFDENELDYDDTCIIRREVLPGGKSRAFVNDTPVGVGTLKTLGEQLIDIHSQHKNLLLSNKNFQFNVLDIAAESRSELAEYQSFFTEWKNAERQFEELEETVAREKADQEYLQFQFKQLDDANFSDGNEQSELETENETLAHAEEIKTALGKCEWLLGDDENGILTKLKEAKKAVESVAGVFAKTADFAQRLSSCSIDLDDLCAEIQAANNDLEFDPNRLNFVSERLNQIYTLEQKHRVKTLGELIALRNELGEKLQTLEHSDEQLEYLRKQVKEKRQNAECAAQKLTERRRKAIPEIEQNIVRNLMTLGIANAQFKIEMQPAELHAMGADTVDFLFSANKNMPPQSIAKIASGGEVARVMLCIKALLSAQAGIATVIFDEIDTGVSGEIAAKMGDIMRKMGQKMQVLSITHLPQIAAKGAAHYKVAKTDTDDATRTHIRRLTAAERVTEIAQMLSGATPTPAAIKNAEELLANS